jgi:hypothetical protein
LSLSKPPELDQLAHVIAAALRRAREKLIERMALHGLTAEAGWRVNEELRHGEQGTEWILRPIHLREPAPELEERVRIDPDGRLVSGEV